MKLYQHNFVCPRHILSQTSIHTVKMIDYNKVVKKCIHKRIKLSSEVYRINLFVCIEFYRTETTDVNYESFVFKYLIFHCDKLFEKILKQ